MDGGSIIGALISFIVGLVAFIALLSINGSTNKLVKEMRRANRLLNALVGGQGIDADEHEPPCRACKRKRKEEVRLVRSDKGELYCPGCGAIRYETQEG